MKRKTTEEERKLFQTHIAEAILKPKLAKPVTPKVAKVKTA